MKKVIFSKLKKALVVLMIFFTIGIAMPKKAQADIINDFIDLILRIPDGIMSIIDSVMASSNEFTQEKLDFKGWDEHGRLYNFIVTPYEIFSSGCYEEIDGKYYTRMGYLDINFFTDKQIISGDYAAVHGYYGRQAKIDAESGAAVSSNILAPVIGNVYKSLRNLCMILMLLVILYIGIKILISSIAEQQAKYKRFLMDWLVGFALLFMMHYIMSGIVNLNSVVIQLLSNDEGDSYYVAFGELQDGGSWFTSHDSTWMDIADDNVDIRDVANDTAVNAGGSSEYMFKTHRLCVRNDDAETSTYSDGIDNYGGLDLRNYSNVKWSPNGAVPIDFSQDRWGNEGLIFLSASICNPTEGSAGFLETVTGAGIGAVVGTFIPIPGASIITGYIGSKLFHSSSVAHPEDRQNRAVVRLNAVSYVRTVSSFASEDNDSVIFYQNGTVKTASTASTMGYSILYVCLVIETIMFLFTYIKRVLQMSFLTMIAPIVAIMYPVDKLGDGKAQAFNTWFKDYLFNVLIQPMHLLLYTVFIVAAGQLIARNIIYGLAIYGFMIPAEKYFKKILGFEKASTSGGGPLGGAIGRGLAMDGLGKIAGIGPAAGRGGNGKDGGKKNRKMKLKKNTPSNTPTSAGGASMPSGAGDATGQVNPQQGRRQGQQTGNRNRPSAPGAPGTGKKGFGAAIGRTIGKRTIRGVTGGKYSSVGEAGGWGGLAKAGGINALKFVGQKGGRLAARGAGALLMGAVGTVAGTATAMATGDINNMWKGATIGAGAGNKIASNTWDRAEGFFSDFAEDVKADRAANDEEYNAKLRQEEARKTYQEAFDDIPEGPDKDEYRAARDAYSPYINLNGDMESIEALTEIERAAHDSTNPHIRDEMDQKVAIFNEAKSWGDLKDSKRAADYENYLRTEVRISDDDEIKARIALAKKVQAKLGK